MEWMLVTKLEEFLQLMDVPSICHSCKCGRQLHLTHAHKVNYHMYVFFV
jgi:hypothetical protein